MIKANPRVRRLFRLTTAKWRLLPDFVIIGAQKSGTTFFYRLLAQHPDIVPAAKKEVQFFCRYFSKSINWYRSHFPLAINKSYLERVQKQKLITGEASTYYHFHPHTPQRLASVIPQAKLIILLRNPIERAYSNYQHAVRNNKETLPFERAIEIEGERLNGQVDRMMEDEFYYSYDHEIFSYTSRGIYVDQLQRWLEYFERDQILVIKSEELFGNNSQVFEHALAFLGIPRCKPKQVRVSNRGRYPEMNPATRERLQMFFEPHNRKLYELLGKDFGWK